MTLINIVGHRFNPVAMLHVLLLLLAMGSPVAVARGAAENAGEPANRSAVVMEARRNPTSGQIDIFEGGKPVLRYNYKTVEPGDVLDKVTPANRIYARPRSDYIHPLYGLNGEVLTLDWPVDHPHHRGIYWAWPEVDFGTNRGDLLRSRPECVRRLWHAQQPARFKLRGAGTIRLQHEQVVGVLCGLRPGLSRRRGRGVPFDWDLLGCIPQ